ncbi:MULTISPECIES: sensor histidine kinase KdpD [unclassified Kitasatospora]|uniref:sensor histidine kinase n=1 Tax=unclassified Kitasatospora TaxID=2633591 RepID=UPI000709776F|nr:MULTISPECIES: ATP-binding protein [unclassified Kitasatospora]KQV11762.1 ATPase [Kitasatospora sp. Root107]KRB76656.1 ATPase [Kitasatospora sp. Root187]
MLGAGETPGDLRPARTLGWLLPTVLTAAAAVVATFLIAKEARPAVGWCGAVATLAVALVAAEAARRGRALTALRERSARQEAELRGQLAAQEAETVQLAEVLPLAVARLQAGEFLDDVLRELSPSSADSPGFQQARQAVLRTVLEAVDAEEGLRESAQRAFVNIARRVQAIVHRQAQDLREMEDRHGTDPAVFDDLLRLDHGNALVGRLADSIAVLGGARPGRQWSKGVPLYSVLRGAVSRILDYQRVELHPVSEVAVVGPAVEPLIHALAELLDNATRYSPPHTNVHLTAVEVQTGIAIEIEDGGLSLSEEGRARAERMLREAQEGIDLNDLGETPRLGLAVVGRLAQAYGFQVSLRPSAYGGVRAVLIVPQDLLTATPATTDRAHGIGVASGPRRAAPASARPALVARHAVTAPAARQPSGPQPWEPSGPQPWENEQNPAVTERAANGLPQRRRHAAATSRPVPIPQAAPAPAPEQPGMWLAAFANGVNGRPDHHSDESSGKGEQ